MNDPVFLNWDETKREEFRRGVVSLRHRLHKAPEFTEGSLAALIERHPDQMSDYCTMGDDPADRDSWRGGAAEGLDGRTLLNAVKNGKLWINLREAMNADAVYRPLFDATLRQLKQLNPGFQPLRAYANILISSPGAQVFYHSDVSETFLLHVKGVKRFRVYPPRDPWVSDVSLENILHHSQTEDIPFDPKWDDDAATLDLQPGDAAIWPLHAPHRVENLEGLNVSCAFEVVTRESMLKNAVLHANGALRAMGWTPRSSSPVGAQAYAKLAFSKAWKAGAKLAGFANRPMPKSEKTFDIDPDAEASFRDRAAA
ncbi:MAG: cupin-like domain-containing protein [Pseudomonadota bacterium]